MTWERVALALSLLLALVAAWLVLVESSLRCAPGVPVGGGGSGSSCCLMPDGGTECIEVKERRLFAASASSLDPSTEHAGDAGRR